MPDISEIMDLIKIAQKNKSYADRFCNLQSYLARELIEKKNYRDAYKIVSSVFTTNVGFKSDAEFLSGWLALRYLNKPKLALQHFNSFNKIVKTPISKSRGLYWLARSYEANANIAEAKKLFALASSQYQYTFYSQMSAIEIDKKTISLPSSVNLEKYNESSTSYLKSSDIAQATLLMSKHGSTCLADAYIKSMINNALDRDERINILAFLNNNLNSTHYISHAAKNAMQKNIFVQKLAYPTPYKLANAPVERPLIYGVIKQESVFDRHAISKANAKGLMQLINITACETAKQLNVRCRVSKLTSDPAYNIKLGSSHLKHLIKKYEGSYILAIAAYNAGVHNVDKWLKTYGDPRKMTNVRNILDWLELIPFYETRNYVQRVLENVQVYRTIIEKNNTFNLKKDLLNIDLSNNWSQLMNKLSIGDIAPDFSSTISVNGKANKNISLSDFKDKFIILYFYPKDSTPGCTLEAKGFNSLLADFKKLDAEVIGISKDDIASHDKFSKKYNLEFPLISDKNSKISEDYGVWQEKSLFGKKYMGITRSTFLIGKDNKIVYVWSNVSVLGHAGAVLNKLEEVTNETHKKS